jgi:hypothetical protein
MGYNDCRAVPGQRFRQLREATGVALGASRKSRRMLFPSISPSAANASRVIVAIGSLLATVLMFKTPTSGSRVAFCANAGRAVQTASTRKAAIRLSDARRMGRVRQYVGSPAQPIIML